VHVLVRASKRESKRARESARAERERSCVSMCCFFIYSDLLLFSMSCSVCRSGNITLAKGRDVAVKAMDIFGDDILVRNKVDYASKSFCCARAHSCAVSLSRLCVRSSLVGFLSLLFVSLPYTLSIL